MEKSAAEFSVGFQEHNDSVNYLEYMGTFENGQMQYYIGEGMSMTITKEGEGYRVASIREIPDGVTVVHQMAGLYTPYQPPFDINAYLAIPIGQAEETTSQSVTSAQPSADEVAQVPASANTPAVVDIS